MAADGSVVIAINGDDKGFKSTLGKLGSVAGTALKGLGVAAGAASAAVVAIGKSAVQSYAEYEQLVGGVDTLFKDSSDLVQEYAANAYKTAGISANEYMSTVTSFSASLLQSVAGDTDAAAKAANTAITDMSDNANKMGTSMESIQLAYQGFAKGQYGLLDNLKLGYGGTISEMERLLADAEKISGVKYDMSNLNDVYSAIHVIQTELGITGTTAKEASSTIQGSASAMKASWDNLLVGMADETQDFDTLLSQFIDSVGTFAENLIPRIQVALGGITKLVQGLGPKIAEVLPGLAADLLPQIATIAVDLVTSLLDSIIIALPALAEAAVSIVETLAQGIITLLPKLIETALELVITLANGIAEALPELIPMAVDAIFTIVDTLIENIGLLIDAALAIMIALAQGLAQNIPEIVKKVPEIISALVTALLGHLPEILFAALEIIVTLASGLIAYIPELIAVMPRIIMGIINGLKQEFGRIKEVGGDLIKGLWQGIKDMGAWLQEKISGFFGGVLDDIKDFFGIHSPSTVLAGIGKNLDEGLAQGITKNAAMVDKAAEKAYAGIADPAKSLFDEFTGDVPGLGKSMQLAVNGELSRVGLDASIQAEALTSGANAAYENTAFDPSAIIAEIRQLKSQVSRGSTIVMDKRVVGKIVTEEQERADRAAGR